MRSCSFLSSARSGLRHRTPCSAASSPCSRHPAPSPTPPATMKAARAVLLACLATLAIQGESSSTDPQRGCPPAAWPLLAGDLMGQGGRNEVD